NVGACNGQPPEVMLRALPVRVRGVDGLVQEARVLAAFTHEDLHEAVSGRLTVDPSLWEAIRPNLDRLEDAQTWIEIAQNGASPLIDPEDVDFVAEALALLPPQPWGAETWKAWTTAVKEATGRKGRALFLPLRRALTGRDHGPDMSAFMPFLRPPAA
ncbi:MAG: hypothetical protein AAF401_14520, partial [Pseudomonadota bacterium]